MLRQLFDSTRAKNVCPLAIAFCLSATFFFAADEMILEGAVVRVDADRRSITVMIDGKEKSLEVIKKAIIRLDNKDGALTDLKPGLEVKLVFDAKLEVVTAVAAKAGGAPLPEVLELTELPEASSYGSPWITPDGLSLYYYTGPNQEIVVATRPSVDQLFGAPKKLFSGKDFSLTGDELEIVFVSPSRFQFYAAFRKTKLDNFSRPQELTMFTSLGTTVRPRLSEDGLALFFDVHPKGQKPIPYVTTRKDRSSAWQKRRRLLFQRLIPG